MGTPLGLKSYVNIYLLGLFYSAPLTGCDIIWNLFFTPRILLLFKQEILEQFTFYYSFSIPLFLGHDFGVTWKPLTLPLEHKIKQFVIQCWRLVRVLFFWYDKKNFIFHFFFLLSPQHDFMGVVFVTFPPACILLFPLFSRTLGAEVFSSLVHHTF